MSTEPPRALHEHRLDHNSSKLPSFRIADVKSPNPIIRDHDHDHHDYDHDREYNYDHGYDHPNTNSTSPPLPLPLDRIQVQSPSQSQPQTHTRTRTRSGGPHSPPSTLGRPQNSRSHHPVPASHSRNDVLGSGPPPAMITQKVSLQALNTEDSTKDWVAHQSALTSPSVAGESKSSSASASASALSSQPTTPLIPPIRGFRTSRRSTEAASRRVSMDHDDTMKSIEGSHARDEQAEHNSDDSDLFLRMAREESAATVRAANRRSQSTQINRQSLPPSSTLFQSAMDRRRESDQGALGFQGDSIYRPPTRERVPTALEVSRTRYFAPPSQSTPITPRNFNLRETSPESHVSQSRRPSITDSASSRPSYRQSNLSHAYPRTFNSSPLVSRISDVQEAQDVPHVTDGTESTASTTAASTVWDELDDLKSRIHRLELTGKLPATSGAAISRASNDRPPTATTTVTTLSSSPKRLRNNSTSPTESALPLGEIHPLLTSALAKSKSLLNPEVYTALEAASADALAITSMMGTSGQPGPISSSQSTIGAPSGGVSDRQVRRRADGLCRSLTELCLALSETQQHEGAQAGSKQAIRPRSRDTEVGGVLDGVQRPPLTDLTRLKSSPRAPSRLEARRSSLLIGSSLPSPRYAAQPDVTTPTQISMAGRRSSLLLRPRRAATEELEEEEVARLRTPSRAATELGRVTSREFASQQPLPDSRLPTTQSSLPPRRHYVSTSMTNNSTPPLSAASGLGSRRYLDRSTPERNTASLLSRAAEDRGQRKLSVGQIPISRTSSISRRVRQSYADSPPTAQAGSYQ